MKNRVLKFLTLGAALCGMSAWAAGTLVPESTIGTGGTISLGEGEFTTYGTTYAQGKTLVFEGAGADKTTWWYGKASGPSASAGSDGGGCSDYSLQGSNVKFVNLTLCDSYTENNYYRGFVRPASMTFENCTIKNMMGYLGTGDVLFKNCTFDVPSKCEYAVKTYSGQNFYFEGCTFKGNNKGFIQAYMQDGSDKRHTIVIKDCSFESVDGVTPSKTAVYFYDQGASEGARWDIYFLGNNTNDGAVPVDATSGEWLWGSMKYQDKATAKVYQQLSDGLYTVWQNNGSDMTPAEYPAGYVPTLTYTRVDNFFADETPPTAYVEEFSEEVAAEENMECEFAFRAWSESDFAIFEKCYDASSHSFDLDALTAAEKARFEEVAAAIEPYAGCHADFVVKFDRPVKANSVMLKGNYGNYGWLGFELTRDMAANEELRLLNDGVEGLQIRFSYQMILTDVVEFLCGAVNLSAANFGTTMTVELRLYEPVTSAGDKEISNYDPETGRYMVIGTYSHTFRDPNYREVRISTTDSVLKDADGAKISAPTAAQSGILANVQGTVGANTPSEDMTGTGVIPAAQAAVTDAGDASISGYVKIRLDAVQVTMKADSTAALKSIAYDVTPMAIITRVDGEGQTTVEEQVIPNGDITAPITFRLPVTAEFVKGARITHDSDADRFAKIETEDGKRFVTVSADHFSVFTLYPDDVAEAAVASSNIMAVKRVPGGSPRAEVVAPVPWKRLDDVTQDMTVSRLVATGRANADEIAVWNESRRGYDVWRWSESQGVWEAGMTTDKTPVTSPAAETTTLKQGAAVWFKRGTPAAAYSEIGGYTSGNVTSKPVSGTAANTLMINPYFKAVRLSDIAGSTGDQIQIISTKKVYVWKGSWGSMKIVDQVTPFGTFKTEQFVAETAPIVLPAGEGFWYISRGGTPTVDWKAIVAE